MFARPCSHQALPTRRQCLRAATVLAAPMILPRGAFGLASRPAPSNTIHLGIIGLGSMGLRHVQGFLTENDCRIIAVCDVDANRRIGALSEITRTYAAEDCAAYNDFRDLLAREDVDAVCIAVPDHWHAVIAIAAAAAGKDIYGEKPIALTIAEGRAVVEAVRKYGRVFQTGSWQRSVGHFRHGCELVRNGRIGKLGRVEVGFDGRFNPGPGRAPTRTSGPGRVEPPPAELDYELWLGPAPWAPYTTDRCHWNFRWILDYSGGQVTDWGAHHLDIAQWGLGADETGPVHVAGRGTFPDDGLWDAAVEFQFACRYANGVEMSVGSLEHHAQGVRFIGDSGWVHLTREGIETSQTWMLRETIGPEEVRLYRSPEHREGHRRNFLDCVRTRGATCTPAEVGHRSATVAHLGNISLRLGRAIRWDPLGERVVGDASAGAMVSRPLRGDWRI